MNGLELKKSVFSAHSIFSTLTAAEIAGIADQVDKISLTAGEIVFNAGDPAERLFLVQEGEIAVIKTDDYGNTREIARVIKGDSLGEMDMIGGQIRNVTARSDTKATLLRIPSPPETFATFVSSHPGPGSKILFAFIADIAERTRAANAVLKDNSPHIQELRRQIYEDKLTGAYNKTFLEENLPKQLKEAMGPISLLMVKPDNFKQINDLAGHEAGDNLLARLVALLPAILPADCLLIRYIGNEFALVVPGMKVDEAKILAGKVRTFYNGLDVSRYLNDQAFRLSVSIGIASYPLHAGNAADLIETAHRLPLIGRDRGGNQILLPEDYTERKP